MKRSQLQRRHGHCDPDALLRRRDLFEGGEAFRSRVSKYLVRNDLEPGVVWQRRCAAAHYVNYTAPLVNLFASWLFTREIDIDPAQETSDAELTTPPFYEVFEKDCDGQGTNGSSFLRARLVDSLVDSCAFWQVCFPEPDDVTVSTRADWEKAGAGRATLRPIKAAHVINWRRAKRRQDGQPGRLLWLLEYQRDCELIEITDADETVTETWTLWRDDGEHRRWEVSYPKSRPVSGDTEIPEAEPPYDPTGTMPIVDMHLPHELRLVEQLSSTQLEIFRKRCGLSWAIDRTCYAMPVLKTEDGKPLPTMGTGYYLSLRHDDSLEWPAPPSTPYDTIGSYIATLKDELHRVAIAMAQGVDNNAAAIGRSGESKNADANATQKVLVALGEIVVLAWERTFDLVSRGRGEPIRWQATGMDNYDDIEDVGTLIEDTISAQALKIPSDTLERQMLLRIARSMLGDEADDATIAKVRDEILAPKVEVAKDPGDVLIGDYDAGLLLVNEIRARKGEGPIEGGDVTTIVWKAQQDAIAARIIAAALPPAPNTAPLGAAQPLPAQPGQDAAQQAARTSA